MAGCTFNQHSIYSHLIRLCLACLGHKIFIEIHRKTAVQVVMTETDTIPNKNEELYIMKGKTQLKRQGDNSFF